MKKVRSAGSSCLRCRYEPCYQEVPGDMSYLYVLDPGRITIPDSTDKTVYVGKQCTHCGMFIPKQEGNFLKICRYDGSTMMYKGIKKRWGTFIKLYQCSNRKCGCKMYVYTTDPNNPAR